MVNDMIELLSGRIDIDESLVIKEYYTPQGNIKILYSNGAMQSITWIDESKRNDIVDYYYRYFFDLPVVLNKDGKECLLLGGGAFTYPKYYISNYLDKNMTVVEINEKCIDLAKQHFYLDELINKYDPEEKRLKIIKDNAIKYIQKCNQKYDYVLIDLFDGLITIEELYTNENIKYLKKIITKNGTIVINYVISPNNINTYKESIRRIIKITKQYKIITNKNYYNSFTKLGNVLIILSNNTITIPSNYDYIEKNKIFE